MTDAAQFEETFDQGSKVHQVYLILKDREWHCRACEYQHTGITQIAGGSGIQGLQRGTQSRPGMVIESGNHFCKRCEKTTRHDRWQGGFQPPSGGSSMPAGFAQTAVRVLGSRDVVEKTERPPNQLTIDHKLPRLRWTEETAARQTDYAAMDDKAIKANFQLLKKSNGSVSHNLLKSRACERCYKTGKRGKPFGIAFFYAGGADWAPRDKKDPAGCDGCGWYDFAVWRERLNRKLRAAANG